MPRSARLDLPDLLQHVIVRGVDRCDIFRDDADRRRFLESFSKLLVQTGTECLESLGVRPRLGTLLSNSGDTILNFGRVEGLREIESRDTLFYEVNLCF